jgi:queuosine precursor transporter
MNEQITESSSNKKLHYKYIQLMSLLYVTFVLITMVIENRVIMFGDIKILSGTLIIPLSYAVSDIITEVYGYSAMRRLIWNSILVLYIAAGIIFIVLHLPTGTYSAADKPYQAVFSSFLRDVVTYSIAVLVSIFLNSYIMSKWKILTEGRIFLLRSLGSTAIGEALFILTWGFLGFSTQFPLHTLLVLMAFSYVCKLAYNLVAIIPTSIVATLLKNKEGIDVYDYGVKFNPFSLS